MQPISVNNLSKAFGAQTVLDGITLEVQRGELFALLGPDGSGKTTLCRILAGIMDAGGGSAQVEGYDVTRNRETIKNYIGYMPQNFGLYPDLSVEENIYFYADLYGVPPRERGERMQRLMTITNLAPFTQRLAGNLSGGMKQKLTLSACLIHTPRILILDEPTFGVDPISRREFWKLLYDLLKDGVTIMVSTSYMDEAQRCNRLAILDKGRMIACDTPEGIRKTVPGVILELVPSELPKTQALLARVPGVQMVTTFGETLHVLVPGDEAAIWEISNLVQDAGITESGIRTLLPSIEDAFIYFTSGVRGTASGPPQKGGAL